jgi:AcrR family transcriptional regulator
MNSGQSDLAARPRRLGVAQVAPVPTASLGVMARAAGDSAGRKTTGTRGRLSRVVILDAAMKILTTEGLDKLTMRRLGDELGVASTAIYWHLRTRDEILAGVVERVVDTIEIPTPGSGRWDVRAAQLCRSIRAALLEHPFLFVLTLSVPVHRTAQVFHALIEILVDAGFELAEAVPAARLLDVYSSGYAFNESQERTVTAAYSPDDLRSFHAEWLSLSANAFEIVPLMANLDRDAVFERGLDDHLEGLRRDLAAKAKVANAVPAKAKAQRSSAVPTGAARSR